MLKCDQANQQSQIKVNQKKSGAGNAFTFDL